MCDEPGVELAGFAGSEAEQQVEFALGERLRPIDPLIGDHEVRLLGGCAGEGALRSQLVEETLYLRLCALPGGWAIVLEQHPARALLDARGDEQRQAPG